jgi:hypothetical protein
VQTNDGREATAQFADGVSRERRKLEGGSLSPTPSAPYTRIDTTVDRRQGDGVR